MLNDIIIQLENELNILKQLQYEKNSLMTNSLPTEVKIKASAIKLSLIANVFNTVAGSTIIDNDFTRTNPFVSVTIRGKEYAYVDNGGELDWYAILNGKLSKIYFNPLEY